MKTINVEPHTLRLNHSVSTSEFTLQFEGTSPGGEVLRVKVKLDGPMWVGEIAQKLHQYLAEEQRKLHQAGNHMRNAT